MKTILGLLVVPTCVIGGFLLHHGQLALLFVPTEYLIIVGCLAGAMIIKNPGHVLKSIPGSVVGLFGRGGPGRTQFVGLLQMLYELLAMARVETPVALEEHADDPRGSSIISKYPDFLKHHHAVAFLCDSLKLMAEGRMAPHVADELLERDLEVVHHEEMEPSEALNTAADSLPAIGIIAAVLGIILTMSSIDEG
ncbi:MAG: motility-associated protein, partial [Myxococcota bacterium]